LQDAQSPGGVVPVRRYWHEIAASLRFSLWKQ
jgi:hypothetical protein